MLVKCPVQGHSGCELERDAEHPPSRSDEKRQWSEEWSEDDS